MFCARIRDVTFDVWHPRVDRRSARFTSALRQLGSLSKAAQLGLLEQPDHVVQRSGRDAVAPPIGVQPLLPQCRRLGSRGGD